jgi:hypothetical protein
MSAAAPRLILAGDGPNTCRTVVVVVETQAGVIHWPIFVLVQADTPRTRSANGVASAQSAKRPESIMRSMTPAEVRRFQIDGVRYAFRRLDLLATTLARTPESAIGA